MAIEIERKFLVTGNEWKQGVATHFSQGYLNRDKTRTVRVRVAGDKAFLTIKGISTRFSREEFEYEIPDEDAVAMLNLCDGPVIQKIRYVIIHNGFKWEVDEFLGANFGLVVAEIELDYVDQPFECPTWIGEEVTDDARYFNSNLATMPYSKWTNHKA
jgi:CYTH domain-containing protein